MKGKGRRVGKRLPAWATAYGHCKVCNAYVALCDGNPHPSHERGRTHREAVAEAARKAVCK